MSARCLCGHGRDAHAHVIVYGVYRGMPCLAPACACSEFIEERSLLAPIVEHIAELEREWALDDRLKLWE